METPFYQLDIRNVENLTILLKIILRNRNELNINIEEPVSKFINNPEKEILLYWYIKGVLLKRFPTP